jgi:hypothetical protein
MNTQNITDVRIAALAKFFECDADEISEAPYGDNVYEHGNREYLVLTDDEAHESCKNYVRETAWAFNASFLSDQTGLPEAMFAAVQDKCEGANDAVLQCIEQSCGLDSFVSDALAADGRGHFLAGYDGHENEVSGLNDEGKTITYFIYRTN